MLSFLKREKSKQLEDKLNDAQRRTGWEDLPEEARQYVQMIEQAIGCPIGYVSVGAERDSLIVR